MSYGRRPRRGRGERGQSLVEFYLVLPLLCLFLAGVFELGWYVHVRTVVDQAALQGARVAAVEGAVGPDASSAVDSVLKGSVVLSDASLRLCVGSACESAATGSAAGEICNLEEAGTAPSAITVSVTYHYKLLFPFLGSPFGLDIGKVLERPYTASFQLPAEVGWIAGESGPAYQDGVVHVCSDGPS